MSCRCDDEDGVIVRFPLRGNWIAVNTPAHRIPSHGTNRFGQRYAYDFCRIGPNRFFSPKSVGQYLFRGIGAHECYAWGEAIYSPVDGVIVDAQAGETDRVRVNFWRDQFAARFLSRRRARNALKHLFGNYLLIQAAAGFYVLMLHLRQASLRVSTGDTVAADSILAEVGNSGNTTSPHLHFQAMDSADIYTARGVPCCFSSYERWNGVCWETIMNGVPSRFGPIRLCV